MGLPTWRRFHGELVAAVIARDTDAYTVAVWHEPSGVCHQLPRLFPRLEAAKAAADDLLRRMFTHKCGVDSCGEWLVWSVLRESLRLVWLVL